MIMATTSCSAGKVILSIVDNHYRVRLEDEQGDRMGEEEYAIFPSFEAAMDQFITDTEELLNMLDDSPGDWGGN